MPDRARLLALAEECERAAQLSAGLYLKAQHDKAQSQTEIGNIAHHAMSVLADACAALRALAEEASDERP